MSDVFQSWTKRRQVTKFTFALDGTTGALMEDTVITMESTLAVMGGPTVADDPRIAQKTLDKPRIKP